MSDRLISVLEQVRHLSPTEKKQLVESLMPEIENAVLDGPKGTRRVWRGIFEGMGPVPSAEDIRDIRREAWPET
jgi:hypothetical protein